MTATARAAPARARQAAEVTTFNGTLLAANAQPPVTRATASAMYHAPFGSTGLWATTVAFGTTHAREAVFGGILDATSVGALVASSLSVADRHTVFGRAEVGRMPAHHLHAHEYSLSLVPLGYVRPLPATKGLVPGFGGSVSLSVLSTALAPRYFGCVAPGFAVFFSIRPARDQM